MRLKGQKCHICHIWGMLASWFQQLMPWKCNITCQKNEHMSKQQKHIDLAKHQTLEIKVPAHIVHFHPAYLWVNLRRHVRWYILMFAVSAVDFTYSFASFQQGRVCLELAPESWWQKSIELTKSASILPNKRKKAVNSNPTPEILPNPTYLMCCHGCHRDEIVIGDVVSHP